jgi:hypothetical protein
VQPWLFLFLLHFFKQKTPSVNAVTEGIKVVGNLQPVPCGRL